MGQKSWLVWECPLFPILVFIQTESFPELKLTRKIIEEAYVNENADRLFTQMLWKKETKCKFF